MSHMDRANAADGPLRHPLLTHIVTHSPGSQYLLVHTPAKDKFRSLPPLKPLMTILKW
jgi:hypothetical protein